MLKLGRLDSTTVQYELSEEVVPLRVRVPKNMVGPPQYKIQSATNQTNHLFVEIKRASLLRGVWEEDESVDRNANRDAAVDDEQPSPACDTMCAVHVRVDRALHYAGE